MCLLSVDPITSKRQYGYKVFRKKGNKYYAGITSDAYPVEFEFGKWKQDPKESKGYVIPNYRADDGYVPGKLIRGFNVLFYKKDAYKVIEDMATWYLSDKYHELVVCKVKVNGISCSGPTNWDEDFHPKTIVVDECKIIEELK
jgi:hypothetical protein